MKKLNYITILGLAAGLTFAGSTMAESSADGIYKDESGAWMVGTSHQSAYVAVENSTLTINWVRNSSGKAIAFGFYTVDDQGNKTLSEQLGIVKSTTGGQRIGPNNQSNVEDQTSNSNPWSKTFSKNDMVGIWVAEVKYDVDGGATTLDPTYYSTENGKTSVTSGPGNSEGNGLSYTWFAKKKFGAETDGIGNASIQFELAGASATGGPLPGVWATIALAGAASAYLKRRRKENK